MLLCLDFSDEYLKLIDEFISTHKFIKKVFAVITFQEDIDTRIEFEKNFMQPYMSNTASTQTDQDIHSAISIAHSTILDGAMEEQKLQDLMEQITSPGSEVEDSDSNDKINDNDGFSFNSDSGSSENENFNICSDDENIISKNTNKIKANTKPINLCKQNICCQNLEKVT